MTEPSQTRQITDWQEAYARLERGRQALDGGEALSPEAVEHILQDRARALARPREAPPTVTETLELLVFALGEERYAVEAEQVLETIFLRELTPVPCTPAIYLGVVNHRGRILPVLDLRRLFELAGQGATEGSRVVAVDAGGMTFGIFADAVEGLARVGAHELAPPPASLVGDSHAFVQGVARGVKGEMVAVLDLDALARDARIVVNEEVG